MQPEALGARRLLLECAEERDHAEAEARHGQGRPDPGERGPVQSERGPVTRQAGPLSRQIRAGIDVVRRLLIHGSSVSCETGPFCRLCSRYFRLASSASMMCGRASRMLKIPMMMRP